MLNHRSLAKTRTLVKKSIEDSRFNITLIVESSIVLVILHLELQFFIFNVIICYFGIINLIGARATQAEMDSKSKGSQLRRFLHTFWQQLFGYFICCIEDK